MLPFRLRLRDSVGPISTEDYRELARRSVPKMVWAYLDGGAEDHVTIRANRAAFGRWTMRRRALTGDAPRTLSTSIAGIGLSMPVLLAPTGITGIAHWQGERAALQAAERAGTVGILSTASSWSLEEVSEATEQSHWFQLYPWAAAPGSRDLSASFMDRAKRSGYSTLVVTVDVPTSGNREDEQRTGMGADAVVTPAQMLDAMRHPRWLYHLLREQRTAVRILAEEPGFAGTSGSVFKLLQMFRPELVWDDLAWMREYWRGPLFVKGILDAEDAARAVDLGAEGIIVSNHGGRQLDGAPATLDVLPSIAARVGDRAVVMLDGGIRRGTDVVKALCLGADAVCIGRPYVHGLAARGGDGVEHVLEILREETIRAMTLMGVGRIDQLDESWLLPAGTADVVCGRTARCSGPFGDEQTSDSAGLDGDG